MCLNVILIHFAVEADYNWTSLLIELRLITPQRRTHCIIFIVINFASTTCSYFNLQPSSHVYDIDYDNFSNSTQLSTIHPFLHKYYAYVYDDNNTKPEIVKQ